MIRPSSAAHGRPPSTSPSPAPHIQGAGTGMRSPSPPPSSIDTRSGSPSSYSPWGSNSSNNNSPPSSPLRPGPSDTVNTLASGTGTPAASIQLPLSLPLPHASSPSTSSPPSLLSHHASARQPQPLSDPRDSAALLWTSLVHAACRFPPAQVSRPALAAPPPPLGLLSTLRRGLEGTRDAASDGAPILPSALALLLVSAGVLAKCRVGTCAAVGVWADILGAVLDLVLVRTVWVAAGTRHDGLGLGKVAEACGSAVGQMLVALLDAGHASLISTELESFFDRVACHLTTHSAYPALFPTLCATLSHAHSHGVHIPRNLIRAVLASLPHAATHDTSFALFSFCLSLAIHPAPCAAHVQDGNDGEPPVEAVAITSLLHPYTSRISAWDLVRSQLIAQLLTTLEPDSVVSPVDPFPLSTMRFGALDRALLFLCASPQRAPRSPQSIAPLDALEFLLLVLTHASPALHRECIIRRLDVLVESYLVDTVTQATAVNEVAVGLKCLAHAVRLVDGGERARTLLDVMVRTRRRWGHDLKYAQAVLEAMHIVPHGFVGSDAIPILEYLSSLRSADLRSRFTTWLTSHALPHLPVASMHHLGSSFAAFLHFVTATHLPSLAPMDKVHAFHACAGSPWQAVMFPADNDVHAFTGCVPGSGAQHVAVLDSPPRPAAALGGGGASSGSMIVHAGAVQPPVDHLHALDMPETLDELVDLTRQRWRDSRGVKGGEEEAWMNRLGIRWLPLAQPGLGVESVHAVAEPISPPNFALLAQSAQTNLMRVATDIVSPCSSSRNNSSGIDGTSMGNGFFAPAPFSTNGNGRMNSSSPPPDNDGGPRRMSMPSDALDGLMVASMSDAELFDAIPVRD
ncbi:hypothetical protein BCR44DRAFT_53548 [Catenaria anguillulae PL171]|uniref:Uncharacterized protein n=1 Tax=Catenaria anguillulae PL171 TaxID=765915 RepID=A0A1Y2HSN5_9FUNG|nr:hypothetical protein BCR44DRAFT_53548 [Catenaria anguillulae PL171]